MADSNWATLSLQHRAISYICLINSSRIMPSAHHMHATYHRLIFHSLTVISGCISSEINRSTSVPNVNIQHSLITIIYLKVQKTRVFKKSNPLGFLRFIGFFRFFYLNKQLGSLLVDLVHQLSFYLDLSVLFRLSKNSQIHYLMVTRNRKP